jgi:hypothetical protein
MASLFWKSVTNPSLRLLLHPFNLLLMYQNPFNTFPWHLEMYLPGFSGGSGCSTRAELQTTRPDPLASDAHPHGKVHDCTFPRRQGPSRACQRHTKGNPTLATLSQCSCGCESGSATVLIFASHSQDCLQHAVSHLQSFGFFCTSSSATAHTCAPCDYMC